MQPGPTPEASPACVCLGKGPSFGAAIARDCRYRPRGNPGTNNAVSNPGEGSSSTAGHALTRPSTRSPASARNRNPGPTELRRVRAYFLNPQAERRLARWIEMVCSAALITTGRPSSVPVSRPARISLGKNPCLSYGFLGCHAESIRRVGHPVLSHWES